MRATLPHLDVVIRNNVFGNFRNLLERLANDQLFDGADLPPMGGDLVFSDGFETGDSGQWNGSTL